MVVSVQHFRELTNGYEKTTSGLWTHKGRADIGAMRVVGPIMASATGAGMELLWSQAGVNSAGIIQAYDRDAAAWRQVYLRGSSVNLEPQGGTLNVPTGSIGTAALAPGAAQATIGSYATPTSFTSTTVGAWLATPVTTGSIACTGVLTRVECSSLFYHSVLGGTFYTGLMVDGALYAAMTYISVAQANYTVAVAWTYYLTPAVGNHTFTLTVHNISAGTLTMFNPALSTLYVTEQRR